MSATNFYESPAEANFISQFTPIPFDDLYRVSTSLINQHQMNQAKLDQFYKDYKDFISPSAIDTQAFYDKTMGVVAPIAEQMSQNIDSIKNPEFVSNMYNTLRNVDYAGLSNLQQSRENMLARQKLEQELSIRGKYNPDWHGMDYGSYDTSTGGVFNDLSLIPYQSIQEGADPYLKNLARVNNFIKEVDGFEYFGVTPETLAKTVQENINAYAGSQEGQMHLQSFKKYNPKATDAEAMKWLADEMYQAGRQYVHVDRRFNPYSMQALKMINKMSGGRGSGSGEGTSDDGSLETYRQERRGLLNQNIRNLQQEFHNSLKDKLTTIDRSVFEDIIRDTSAQGSLDIMNKNPKMQEAYNSFAKYLQNETNADGSKSKSTTIQKAIDHIDNLRKSGLINDETVTNIYNKLGMQVSNEMSGELQSQISQAALTGDNRLNDAFNRSKAPIAQETVHQWFEAGHPNLRLSGDNVPLSSSKSNAVRMNIRPNSMYVTENGIPMSEISAAYLVGPGKYKKTDPITYQIPGLLDYIQNKSNQDVIWSAGTDSYLYTPKNSKLPSEYVQGVQYMPKSQLKNIVQSYIDEQKKRGTNINMSADNILEILLKKGLGNGRTIGFDAGDLSVGYGQGKDYTLDQNEKMKGMVGLYLSQPVDEMYIDPAANRNIERAHAKDLAAKEKLDLFGRQNMDYTFTKEEIAREIMLQNMLMQQRYQQQDVNYNDSEE